MSAQSGKRGRWRWRETSPQFPTRYALSQYHRPDYLGAWNRLYWDRCSDVTLYTFMVKRYHQCQKLRWTSWLQLGVTDPPYGKRWRLYILPQFLSNLTRPITHKVILRGRGGEVRPCNGNIAYPWFKVYKTFLCVFMSSSMVFIR